VVVLRLFSLGFGWGCMHEPFVVLFLVIPLPNSWVQVLIFGVFLGFGKLVFLVEILWFLLIQRVLVHQIVAIGCPCGTPSIPKALCEPVERIERSGFGIREAPLCESVEQIRAAPYWVLNRVNILVCSLVSRLAAVSSLVLFGARELCLLDLGFPRLDRPDGCRSIYVEIIKSCSGDLA
jgi:hypothetical protein